VLADPRLAVGWDPVGIHSSAAGMIDIATAVAVSTRPRRVLMMPYLAHDRKRTVAPSAPSGAVLPAGEPVDHPVGDQHIHSDVVGFVGDTRHDLAGERHPDPQGVTDPRQHPVVVSAALTEAPASKVEGDPGDHHRIDQSRIRWRAQGFADAAMPGGQRVGVPDRHEVEVLAPDPGIEGANPAPPELGGGGFDIHLGVRCGVDQHHAGREQLGQ